MDAKKLGKALELHNVIQDFKERIKKLGTCDTSVLIFSDSSVNCCIYNQAAIKISIEAVLTSLRDQLRQKENEFKLL